MGCNLAASAEPQPAIGFERLTQGNRQTSSRLIARRVRDSNPIRNDNEPRQLYSPEFCS